MDESQHNLYCMKDARQKAVHTMWFHLCRILENENQFVVKGSRSVVAWEWGMEVDGLQTQHKETFEGDEYIYYFDCGDGFTVIFLRPSSSNSSHLSMCMVSYDSYTSIKL